MSANWNSNLKWQKGGLRLNVSYQKIGSTPSNTKQKVDGHPVTQ